MPHYESHLKKTDSEQSLLAILSFSTRLNLIKNSIIDLSEVEEIYSVKILYRSRLLIFGPGTSKRKIIKLAMNTLVQGKLGELLKYGNSVRFLKNY